MIGAPELRLFLFLIAAIVIAGLILAALLRWWQ